MKSELKSLLSALVIFVCVFMLSGCGVKESRTVVQFASWGSKSEVDIIKPLLNDFEKQNPGIKVDFMHIPQNYFQKIHLLFASNTAPDVIFINNQYLPVYANAGVLEELESETKFYSQAVKALSWNGKLYAIPRDVSNLVLFYNKDLFDKNGVSYPSDNWTFEEFLGKAKQLSKNGNFGISFEEDPLFYLPYLMSNGGGFYDTDKPESRDAIDFYADLRKKYHVAPEKSESASATMAQIFLQQRLGMYLSGRWMVPKLREEANFNWDIAKFPKGTKGSIVPLDASGWAIAKSSLHKEEAMKLVNYLSSAESIKKLCESGLIVPALKEASACIFDNKKPESSRIFLDVIETSVPTPVTVDYREVLDKLKKDMEPRFN